MECKGVCIMKTYPNQKIISVQKDLSDKENIYAIMNKERLFEAIKELTHNELKVYLYLNSNQQGYEFALSTKDIAEKTGADKSRIQGAIRSLAEKGYLRLFKDNIFAFYEYNISSYLE